MALDDPASDADETRPAPSGGELRFTTRTFLSPEGTPPQNEPGDGAAGEVPASFGTGEIDDDALDAIVQDAAPEPTFVWAADDLAAAEPQDPTPADPSEFMTFTGDPSATPQAGPGAEADGPPSGEDRPENGSAGSYPAGGLGAALTAAGAGVLGALANVVGDVVGREDDEPSADADVSPDAEAASDADTSDADAATIHASPADDLADRDRQPAGASAADLSDVPHDAEDATADVDQAFEAATDADKADAPGPDGVEGDLEVAALGPDDFEPDELRAVLRTMMTSRRLDEKMLTLLKQGKGFFHIGSAGHEASQIAVASQFEGGKRLVLLLLPRPRDRAPGGRDAGRDPARALWQAVRPVRRRAPDAGALRPPRAQHHVHVVVGGRPVRAGGRVRAGD